MTDEYAPVVDLEVARLRRACRRLGARQADIDAHESLAELRVLHDLLLKDLMSAPGPERAA